MSRSLGTAAANLLLISIPTLLLLLLALEILARVFLPVSDYPQTRFDPALGNRYVANQRGTIVAGEIRAKYRINGAGWNSHREYPGQLAPNTVRIAVIGDSYIEAFQVDVDRSYPALLEERLNRDSAGKIRFEVYAFGMSGANLTQYAFVLEDVRSRYPIDLAIINIVANDFAESLHGRGRKDNWTLLDTEDGFVAVAPQPANNLGLKLFLRRFALIRYLVINQGAPRKVQFVRNVFYGDVRNFEDNVDVRDLDPLADTDKLEELLRELLHRYRAAARGASVRIVLDANRGQLYADEEDAPSKIRPLFAAAQRAAAAARIPVLDLAAPFREDWLHHQQKFEFAHDGHWNAHAHRVVADAVASWLEPMCNRPSDSPDHPTTRGCTKR